MGDYLALMMFPALLLALFLGFPVAFSMMGVALFFGLVVFDTAVIFQFVQKIDAEASNFVLAAVPLFIFMGAMLEVGIEKLIRDASIFLHMDATVDISHFKIVKAMFPETAGKYAGKDT